MPVSKEAASQASEQTIGFYSHGTKRAGGLMLPAIADGYATTHPQRNHWAPSKVTFSTVSATPKPPPAPTASDASEVSTVTPRRVADIEGRRKD
jgi:hypothetical protein